MKRYKVTIKIIFNKKTIFRDKEKTYEVYVDVPDRWKKYRAELSAVEKMESHIKKWHPRMFKKKAYKIVTTGCQTVTFVPTGAKFVFRYND